MKTALAAAAGLTLLLAAAARGAPAAPVAAAAPNPNWYNVEVIVFRSLDAGAGSGETWPLDPGTPDWNAALPLNPPNSVGPAVPFQALSPVGEQLGEQWNRLRRSKGYEPVLHVTWTQPIGEQATAPAVRIGVPPSAAPTAVTTPAVTPAAPALTGAAAAAAAALQPTPIYGTAKLSTTGPYLHFDLDLVLVGQSVKTSAPVSTTISAALVAPATGAVAANVAVQLYRLKHGMRVNGGKAAYFDHPLFGAIVLVTPVRH